VTFSQKWSETKEDIDLPQLSRELSLLLPKLSEEASSTEEYQAVGEVANAKKAAEANDGPRTLEYLARAGNWALNTATTIGTTIAAAAIKAALGLP
jgi:hypothetical protein